MKIKTPFFVIEIETLFIITFFITVFSEIFRNYIYSYYICYLFIIFHEFSHIFVAAILGKKIELFKFSLSGVNIKFCGNNREKKSDIIIYFAGPISNIVLALIFSDIYIVYQLNIFLALINLIPIYPLDGYNILNNVIKNYLNLKNRKKVMKIINNIFYIILLLLGIFQVIFIKNPSVLIFLVYIFLLNQNNQKNIKFQEIINEYIC